MGSKQMVVGVNDTYRNHENRRREGKHNILFAIGSNMFIKNV